MVEPHGGELIDQTVNREYRHQLKEELNENVVLDLDRAHAQDVRNIANGRYSPLKGFMSRNDYEKVINDMTLEDGTLWPLPITLDVSAETAKKLIPGEKVGLQSPTGAIIAVLDIDDVYKYNKRDTASAIYNTTDRSHPGVQKTLNKGEYLVGGEILTLELDRYNDHDLQPKETRVLFDDKSWNTIVGFQTRNAPHRAHEYIQKSALEHVDGLFVQPKVGFKKDGDYRDDIILASYQRLIENYYPQNRTVLSVLPSRMRYAGPREAVFDAIIRKNQGCTHFIVGRDHAGVQDYYDEFEAQRIFKRIGDIGIKPHFYSYSFYCDVCDGMVSEKTCPHEEQYQIHPSGTRIRDTIRNGNRPSEKMMRPEVAEFLLTSKSPYINRDGWGGN
jgi:sulfate adenylyltransferase